jgi:hypothetical protein
LGAMFLGGLEQIEIMLSRHQGEFDKCGAAMRLVAIWRQTKYELLYVQKHS